ncbi:MAG TPA: ABC transporter substrate-binding protein [Patescibacteria group bacterium]|nr:ABC transporter substrate-binding protein [Patescibacteria group bacterium]
MTRGVALCLALLLSASPLAAREIVDMAGRQVTVPDNIRRIYVAYDPPAIFLSALAPDLMIGFPFARSAAGNVFLPPLVRKLPIIGGSSRVNPESLLAQNIDVAIVWNIRGQPDQFAAQLTAMGLPTLMVDASPFRQYPAAFRFLGRLLHREARAEALARALEDSTARLDAVLGAIPQAERVRVYYADSPDGLKSQCAGAFRGETVELAGGVNVMHCDTPDGMGASVTVNLERLLLIDPQVIVARTQAIARFITQDPGWQRLRAVHEGRVYAPPELPFNWVERPHSQFKMLAVQWLANRLYPDRFPFDFARATKDFYTLFYDMELTDDDVAKLRH